MKKIFLLFLAVTGAVLCAGDDLKIDGKFRHLANDLPAKWRISVPAEAKIVRGEDLFSRALQLSGGKKGNHAVSRDSYPVNSTDEVKVEAEIKGSGRAYLAVELLDAENNVVAVKNIAVRNAGRRFDDIKGKLRIADYAKLNPANVRIIFGAAPGAVVIFDDVEAEVDDD